MYRYISACERQVAGRQGRELEDIRTVPGKITGRSWRHELMFYYLIRTRAVPPASQLASIRDLRLGWVSRHVPYAESTETQLQ